MPTIRFHIIARSRIEIEREFPGCGWFYRDSIAFLKPLLDKPMYFNELSKYLMKGLRIYLHGNSV